MQVAHIVPALFSKNGGILGGAERFALELARHMAGHVSTTLISFGDKERFEKLDDLDVKVIGNPRYIKGQRTNPFSLQPLLQLLRKADIVHCHQQHVLASSFTALFCRLTGRQVFVSDLGGGGWDISNYLSTDCLYHGHLHISQYSRSILGQASFPKAHVIFSGVDVNKFFPDDSVRKTGTVLFVGRLLPHKGINYLIEAMPSDMTLEIIGQPYHSRFFEDLQKLSVGKNVIFRHDCDDNTLANAYRRSLCVVLPSVYRTLYGDETNVPELLGQVLLEGMASGIPAICTDVAAMPEAVEDGVSGFVVPPNNPAALRERLVWLRDHAKEALEMGAAGRRRMLEKFTWQHVVRRCLDIYAC